MRSEGNGEVAEAIHRVVCRPEAGKPGLGTDDLVESLSRVALYPRPDLTIRIRTQQIT